jgi:hypothetical protein
MQETKGVHFNDGGLYHAREHLPNAPLATRHVPRADIGRSAFIKARDLFTTIRTEGGLLPADLLQRLVQRDKDLPGLDDTSYHLVAGERLNERISQSWKRLLGAWNAFRTAADALPEGDTGTTLTRECWLLILLQELEYGCLPASRAIEIDGKSYAISHF